MKHLFKKKKSRKKENKKEVRPKVLRQTDLLLPFVSIDEQAIYTKDGCIDLLQIQTKDLYAMNETDLDILLFSDTKMVRSFTDSYKEITLNYPSNTERQREYWEDRLAKAKQPIFQKYSERKLFELEFIEQNRTNREHYMMIFADSVEELQKKKQLLQRLRQDSFPLLELSVEKKKEILFLLNNQNTKLR